MRDPREPFAYDERTVNLGPQYQVYDPEKGSLSQRVEKTFVEAIFSDEINVDDTNYWFTEPEGGTSCSASSCLPQAGCARYGQADVRVRLQLLAASRSSLTVLEGPLSAPFPACPHNHLRAHSTDGSLQTPSSSLLEPLHTIFRGMFLPVLQVAGTSRICMPSKLLRCLGHPSQQTISPLAG